MTYRSEAKHLRVVYYTRPCYFDAVLSMLPYLADRVKLHLIVELSPSQWMTSLFDVPRQDIPTGIITGESLMKPFFPPAALTPFKKLSTLNFIVHTQSRSIHPNTLVANNKAIVLIKKISPDIVHFDDLSLRIALSLWRLRRFRIVLSVHDPIHRSGEKNWRNTLSRKLAFRWISAFILHNNQQRQAFLARYPISNKNVRSIKLGTYNAYRYWSTSDLAQHSNVVLFFGRLSRYKGIATLLRAAKRVDEKIRNVEFILAGRSLPDYELPAIPKLPNGGSIRLCDMYISNHFAAQLFLKATLVVCPYDEATQSGVVLTAYAFNRPVIATRTGGLHEYVVDGHSGLVVEPQKEDQLANAIVALLRDRAKQEKLKSGIQLLKREELSWETISAQTFNFYSELLSNNFLEMVDK